MPSRSCISTSALPFLSDACDVRSWAHCCVITDVLRTFMNSPSRRYLPIQRGRSHLALCKLQACRMHQRPTEMWDAGTQAGEAERRKQQAMGPARPGRGAPSSPPPRCGPACGAPCPTALPQTSAPAPRLLAPSHLVLLDSAARHCRRARNLRLSRRKHSLRARRHLTQVRRHLARMAAIWSLVARAVPK